MRIDWDLSGRHTHAEVTWSTKYPDAYTTQVKPVESVRIRLPEGKVLRMDDQASDVILYRRSQGPEPLPGPEGEVLVTVEVNSDPLTVEDAYRRALPYVKQFDLPRAQLETWRRRRQRGVDAGKREPQPPGSSQCEQVLNSAWRSSLEPASQTSGPAVSITATGAPMLTEASLRTPDATARCRSRG